jgi:hypothetical protein
MSKVLEGPIVIDLLQRHSKVPTSVEILERYQARYAGVPAGYVEPAAPVAQPEPEPQPTRIFHSSAPVAADPQPVDQSETKVLFEVPEAVEEVSAQDVGALDLQQADSHDSGTATISFDASQVVLSIVDDVASDADATRMIQAVGETEPEAPEYQAPAYEAPEHMATQAFEAIDLPPPPQAQPAAVRQEDSWNQPESPSLATVSFDAIPALPADGNAADASQPADEDGPLTNETISMAAFDGAEGVGPDGKKKRKRRHR